MSLHFRKSLFRDWSLIYCEIGQDMFGKRFYEKYNWKYNNVIFEFDKKKMTLYRSNEEHYASLFNLTKKMISKDEGFIEKISKNLIKGLNQLNNYLGSINKEMLKAFSNDKLKKLLIEVKDKSSVYGPDFFIIRYFPMQIDEFNIKEYRKEYLLCLDTRKKIEAILAPPVDRVSILIADEFLRRFNMPIHLHKVVSINNILDWNLKGIELRYKEGFLLVNEGVVFKKINDYFTEKGFILIEDTNNELKGFTAYNSNIKIKGKVRIIENKEEIKQLQQDEILITTATVPEYVPFLKRARAIITEEGGITTHAAIVSRELKIPCIVGITNITKVFKDGDLVEVDANKGVVRKIK